MTPDNLVTVLAILIAPLLAVQVQKWLERFREDRGRRIGIFKTLMATRAAPVSPEHVQALNMIDLEFRGKRYMDVSRAWKTYLDHLESYPKDNNELQPVWNQRRVDLFIALLQAMGKSLGYEFDEVHVKKGIYAPEAHGQLENENMLMRHGLLNLLYGRAALNVNMIFPPATDKAATEPPASREDVMKLQDEESAIPLDTSRSTPQRTHDAQNSGFRGDHT